MPTTDDPTKATLWIYLVPSLVLKDQWYKQKPVQRLAIFFGESRFRAYDLEYTQKFPFGIAGVTPGEYWIKAVLDKTEPLSKEDDKFYLPQEGDYQNIGSPIVTIKAGETVQNVNIDCIYRVANGTD